MKIDREKMKEHRHWFVRAMSSGECWQVHPTMNGRDHMALLIYAPHSTDSGKGIYFLFGKGGQYELGSYTNGEYDVAVAERIPSNTGMKTDMIEAVNFVAETCSLPWLVTLTNMEEVEDTRTLPELRKAARDAGIEWMFDDVSKRFCCNTEEIQRRVHAEYDLPYNRFPLVFNSEEEWTDEATMLRHMLRILPQIEAGARREYSDEKSAG